MTTVPILAAIVVQYAALTAPVLVPVRASVEGGEATPRTGTVPLVQYQATAAPVVVPSQVVSPVTGASPVYPSRVPPRRRLHASQHRAWFFDEQFEAPAAVTVPEVADTQTQMPRTRPYRRGCYVPGHPTFGVQIAVPVMAWTGCAPDRLPQWTRQRHARFSPAIFWDVLLFPAVVTAPDLAQPVYPARIHRTPRLRAYPQPSWPPFIADATVVVPALAWQPEFPDRIWPDRGLAARHHLTFVFDPRPIPVVAVSEVTGRHRFTVPARPRTFVAPARRRKWVV